VIALEVLADLHHRGVDLFVADGTLHYRAPRGVLTPELRAALSAHKAELVALLAPKTEPTRPLDVADCLALIRETFETVATEYVGGALALLDTDPDLRRRFHDTEAAIDAAVKAGPTEGELRAALAAHVAVIRECCERKRAQQEAVSERPDPMPELPADAATAIGVSYGDGKPGTWDVVRQGQKR
jgi:hypothetical protein